MARVPKKSVGFSVVFWETAMTATLHGITCYNAALCASPSVAKQLFKESRNALNFAVDYPLQFWLNRAQDAVYFEGPPEMWGEFLITLELWVKAASLMVNETPTEMVAASMLWNTVSNRFLAFNRKTATRAHNMVSPDLIGLAHCLCKDAFMRAIAIVVKTEPLVGKNVALFNNIEYPPELDLKSCGPALMDERKMMKDVDERVKAAMGHVADLKKKMDELRAETEKLCNTVSGTVPSDSKALTILIKKAAEIKSK